MNRYDLNVQTLLNIDMHGPSVNKKFETKLLESLEKNESTTFICIGTCSLHVANSSFGKGMATLREVVNLDQFQLISTFYLSTCQITDITVHYVLRHCHTQWLITEKVLVRTREQIDNHHEYFLIELPKQKSFRAKTEY